MSIKTACYAGQGNTRAEPRTLVFALFFLCILLEIGLSKMTVYDMFSEAVILHEKPLNFSIKTYLKNYLSKRGVFDIIMVSAREQTRQPRGREDIEP